MRVISGRQGSPRRCNVDSLVRQGDSVHVPPYGLIAPVWTRFELLIVSVIDSSVSGARHLGSGAMEPIAMSTDIVMAYTSRQIDSRRHSSGRDRQHSALPALVPTRVASLIRIVRSMAIPNEFRNLWLRIYDHLQFNWMNLIGVHFHSVVRLRHFCVLCTKSSLQSLSTNFLDGDFTNHDYFTQDEYGSSAQTLEL